jgi:peptidoglycan/xylan/chitin deacetylase (PgdA/CDA1 family)
MKVFSILYHDVVPDGDFASSGFDLPGAAKYKIDAGEFARHLSLMAGTSGGPPASALDLLDHAKGAGRESRFLLTFDDGGVSSATVVAGLLAQHGWRGHFLITTGYIGSRKFVSPDQIRSLRKAGHIVGSHSHSHPARMSACTGQQLRDEWKTSVEILSEILGEKVEVASVPAGWYSPRLAEAAREAGIRVLFHSEPTPRPRQVSGCFVLGRYCVTAGMSAREATALASGRFTSCSKQRLIWDAKKCVKFAAGGLWVTVRDRLLEDR